MENESVEVIPRFAGIAYKNVRSVILGQWKPALLGVVEILRNMCLEPCDPL